MMGGSAATEVREEAVKPAGSAVFVGCGDDGDAGGLVAEGDLELFAGVGEGCLCCGGFGHDRPFLLRLRGFGPVCVRAVPVNRGDMFRVKLWCSEHLICCPMFLRCTFHDIEREILRHNLRLLGVPKMHSAGCPLRGLSSAL